MATVNPPSRCGIYLRLSKLTDSSVSLDVQRRACLERAAAEGYTVVAEEHDSDVSGAVPPLERLGFGRLVTRGDVDVIVAYSLDRVSRSTGDFLQTVAELRTRGIVLDTVRDPLRLDTPQGEAMATITASFATLERKLIGSRVKASRAERLVRGRPASPAPWFLRSVQDADGTLVHRPHPERAAAVQEAVDAILSGSSMSAAVAGWKERGLRPTRADEWGPQAISKLFQSPALYGATPTAGDVVRNADGTPVIDPDRVVIPLATWEHLQGVLASRRTERVQRRQHDVLLYGLIVCDGCGRSPNIHLRATGDGGRYLCRFRGCPARRPSYPVDRAHDYIERLVLAWSDMPYSKVELRPGGVDEDEVARLESAVAVTASRFAERGADRVALAQQMDELEARLDSARAQAGPDRWVAVPTGRTLREWWDLHADDPSERRSMVRAHGIVRVRLLPKPEDLGPRDPGPPEVRLALDEVQDDFEVPDLSQG